MLAVSMVDERSGKGLTRRKTLKGFGAVLGTASLGCSSRADRTDDDQPGQDSNTESSTTAVPSDTTAAATSGDGSTSSGSSGDSSAGTDPSTTGSPEDVCAAGGSLAPEELLADIDTIVVVMMENRSFDHMFGSATFREGWVLDGLTGSETNPNTAGESIAVFELGNLTPADPPHAWGNAHRQWNRGAMNGFVTEHEVNHPLEAFEAMGYHTRSDLPVSYALAGAYTLCDRWFASVMGGTWPNRFYLLSGTSNGQKFNEQVFGLPHVFDALDAVGVSTRNYYSDVPFAWGGYAQPLAWYTEGLDAFFAAAATGSLPNFCVIDPNFGLIDEGAANDDHPPHSIALGQVFVASIYQALAQSPQWNRCLLVVTYDESGGFYDHVAPPTLTDDLPEFEQLGFRVPALAIGPYVRRGCVHSTTFDHASVLATLSKKWGVSPLSVRVQHTNDLSGCIDPETLGNPQPPVAIPQMVISLDDVLRSYPGGGQHELRALIDRGEIPIPPRWRGRNVGPRMTLELLEHAQRLGVVKIV